VSSKGTELVVEFIEKHWCPTVVSHDLLTLRPAAQAGQ